MGKIGIVIDIDTESNSAIIKLDKDGREYQEIKFVKLDTIAVTLEDSKSDIKTKKRTS